MWNEPSIEELNQLPKLYETENVSLAEKEVRIHLFLAGCDWFLVEFDGEDLFFGYAILNGDLDMAEWGYVSFSELKSLKTWMGLEVDRDLFWTPKPAREIAVIAYNLRVDS